jgi:predicted small lipoprotein YifL
MRHTYRATLAIPVLAALAGCGGSQPLTQDDREAVSDCNKESDRIFAARNQYELSERDSRDTPYSGNTLPPTPSDGLSDQYEREQLRDSCLAHSAAGNAVVPGSTPTEAKP